MQANKVGLSF